jgi:butyryl-CoA dehydrogenase
VTFTDEQQMIRDMVREFATTELAPLAAHLDAEDRFPAESVSKLAALNLLGLTVPQEYGGAGVDSLSYALALEEVARVCASTALVLLAHNTLAALPIVRHGDEAQRRLWLEPLASGKRLGAFALSEAESGSDMAAVRTIAVPWGDAWTLHGEKTFVANATRADLLLVAARLEGEAPLYGTFVLDRETPGLAVGAPDRMLGLRGAGLGGVVLESVELSKFALLGTPDATMGLWLETLDAARLGLAAICVGIAQGAFERALRYARERPQFGKSILEFQSVQWHVSDAAVEIAAARSLVHDACRLADTGGSIVRAAATAKLFASEVASRACDRAIQVHGGYGYIADYQVERSYRDAKMCEIAYGTNEMQRLLIVRELIREADAGMQLLQ